MPGGHEGGLNLALVEQLEIVKNVTDKPRSDEKGKDCNDRVNPHLSWISPLLL